MGERERDHGTGWMRWDGWTDGRMMAVRNRVSLPKAVGNSLLGAHARDPGLVFFLILLLPFSRSAPFIVLFIKLGGHLPLSLSVACLVPNFQSVSPRMATGVRYASSFYSCSQWKRRRSGLWRSRPSAAVRNCACVLFSPIDAILTWFDYVVGQPPSIGPSIQQSVFLLNSFHSPLAYFCVGYPITYRARRLFMCRLCK